MLQVKFDACEGVGVETFEYNQNKLMAKEASMVQKYTGRTIQEWVKGLESGDVDCMQALVWLIRKRQGQVVQFNDIDFDLGSFDIVDLDAKDDAEEDASDAEDVNPTSLASVDGGSETSEIS